MQEETSEALKRPRLTLAAVRARTKARTEFALQVIAASQATLDATDALLAASDAILAAPGYSSYATSKIQLSLNDEEEENETEIAPLPEACEASDSSSNDTETPSSPPRQSQQSTDAAAESPPDKDTAKDDSDSPPSSPSAQVSSSFSSTSVIVGGQSRTDLSVDLVLKENTHQPPPLEGDTPVSGSIFSGSFDPKEPIPRYIIGTETDSYDDAALASKDPSPTFGMSGDGNGEEEEDGSEVEESSSGESDSSSSASESGEQSTTNNEISSSAPSDVEADSYVDELLGELQGNTAKSMVQSEEEMTFTIIKKQPEPVTKMTPPPLQPPPPPQPKLQPTAQPKLAPAALQPPPQTSILPPDMEDDNDEEEEEEDEDSDEGSDEGSEEDSSEDEEAENDMEESDTGRPSEAPSDKPSEASDDVEDDDYVEELLSELKETKGAAAVGAPFVPVPKSTTGSVVTASTASVTTASTAPTTTATTAATTNTIKQPPQPALSSKIFSAPPTPIDNDDDDDDEEEEGSEEDSDDGSDDDSEEDSSEEDSSSGGGDEEAAGGGNDEDDTYVDELLKELNATKPSTLVSEQKLAVPVGTAIPDNTVVPAKNRKLPGAISTESAVSDDDDVSDIASSSSSEYDSSDSDLFSNDDVEDISESSDDEETIDESRAPSEALLSLTSDDEDEDDDEYVDDLLNELQAPRVAPPPNKSEASTAQPPSLPANLPLPPPGLPGMAGLPGEGLNLDAIRSELEKVGRAVMTQKSGEAFVARAQILASINQLSSHVPNCVLDFLGKEIRAEMERKKKEAEKKEKKTPRKNKMMSEVSNDDMSEVSELSELDISDPEDDGSTGFLIDTSGVNLECDEPESKDFEDKDDGASQTGEKPAPLSMMRRKSEEALDEMFRQAREDMDSSANRSLAELSEDIENIFNSSNEYGLTKNNGGRGSVGSFGGSIASSVGSSTTKDLIRKSRSFGNSLGSTEWGLEGKLPSISRFECALLFVDISGFTKLSTLLDPETLSKVINSYFQLIVSKIYEFNGDIQKFAGDAIFAEWRCSQKHSMEFCVASATACASQIVDECSDFPVMAGGTQSRTGEPISSLNVHCALGSGQMIGIHVGDNTRRREYLFLGEPIDQLTWGADLAKHGELVVSPEAFRSLSLAGVLDFNIRPSESEPAIIAKRCVTMFRSEYLKDYRVSRAEYAKSRGVTGHVEGLEVEDLKTYQKLMALYVHPVVAAMHMDTTSKIKSKSSAQERHREEAELRRVYIMFIHPLITINEENDFAVDLLNEIMNLTSTQLERYCGHLRQMIVDDKGLVLIGTFGLRGSTFPNMVAERALPATIALHNALQSQLGVDNRIGATFGEVYCGAVGGVKRHEYAVLGPSANLAARLMGNSNNPGILVECNIRRMASRKYAFNALPPVKAKGYAEPVPIFEPLSPLERSWGRIQPNFVGREPEIKALMAMARDIVSQEESHSRLVFVASQSGMGKSTTVAHAIEHIRNMIGNNTRRLVITKHVGKESHALLPFGMFRSILLDVLANIASSTDDKSQASGVTGIASQALSLQSLSCRSQGSSTALSLAKSEELLKVLCKELNAPNGFVDHVLHSLSGTGSGKAQSGKAPSMPSMVSFLERAFRRCTQETKLVVVALDDVQYIDEMTWKVLRRVFEGCENVLMICAFDLSRSRDLKVEADFWQVLNNKYRPSGHFVPMELGGLGKEEITVMTMKTLGLQREEIPPDLLNEIMIQSGGMPHFANEFLELVKRRQFTEMMDGNVDGRTSNTHTMGPNALGSVPEIILHRIDSFDVAVRDILNIAAVLGKSFTLNEVTSVLKENHDLRDDVLEEAATESLEMAVNEGILRMEETPIEADADADSEEDESKTKDTKEKPTSVVYSFYHSIWQTTILSLMLDARKRDVHSKIAMSMEKSMGGDDSDFAFQMKLLGHWKCSGNTAKLTELALNVGKRFEQKLGMPTQSIRVYEEALEAWKDDKPTDQVGGIRIEGLHHTEPEDLEHISALHVALGRACNGAHRNAASVLCFHDALQILRIPRSAEKVSDRSVAFPAYFGLYESLKAKYIVQEDGTRYEQLLIKEFLEDTKHHPNKSHYVHAITCQIDFYRRRGDMAKALGIQKLLYNLYDHEAHAKTLRDTYGSDEAALSFSNSAMWHWKLGEKEAALDACRFVIGKLMPKLDRTDVHQSFVMMYPVVLVMKDTGVAVQARKHFDRLVVKPFSTFFGEGKSSFFLPVYEPIMMLLHLAGSPEDLDEDTLEEYAEWAMDRDRLSFGTLANRRLGALGRCADSLSAEICFLLAERIEEEETRRLLIEHGKEIGQEAMAFNVEQGLKDAEHQMGKLLSRYQPLMGELVQ